MEIEANLTYSFYWQYNLMNSKNNGLVIWTFLFQDHWEMVTQETGSSKEVQAPLMIEMEVILIIPWSRVRKFFETGHVFYMKISKLSPD